jgi:nucleoside-diphosphate-sugar epimerase
VQTKTDPLTVVVTGASGYIGSALVRYLQQQGRYVLRLVTHSDPDRMHVGDDVSTYMVKDFCEASQWEHVLRGADIVVHLAGRAHMLKERASESAKQYYQTNVRATAVFGEMALKHGVRRFVFVSSVGVNGNRTRVGAPFRESDNPHPHNAYAHSKWAAEQELWYLTNSGRMEVVIVRPPLVYGADAPGNFDLLKRAVLRSWPLPLEAVDNRRSLVALDNLVDFLAICMAHPNAGNQTFLVSDGEDVSTAGLIREMSRAAGVSCRLLPVPIWVLRIVGVFLGKKNAINALCDNLQVDISKVRSMLGWSPLVTPIEGVRRAMLGIEKNEANR